METTCIDYETADHILLSPSFVGALYCPIYSFVVDVASFSLFHFLVHPLWFCI